jgi:hypothetical protein
MGRMDDTIIRNASFGVVVLGLVLLSACTKPLKLPDIEAKQLIVLLGELVANDTVHIRAGQSVPIAAGSSMKYAKPAEFLMRLSRSPGYIRIPHSLQRFMGFSITYTAL